MSQKGERQHASAATNVHRREVVRCLEWCHLRSPHPTHREDPRPPPRATRQDMRRAIGAARRAFDEGPWPQSTPRQRSRVLERIADAMERRKEEMRALLVAEAGTTAMTHA